MKVEQIYDNSWVLQKFVSFWLCVWWLTFSSCSRWYYHNYQQSCYRSNVTLSDYSDNKGTIGFYRFYFRPLLWGETQIVFAQSCTSSVFVKNAKTTHRNDSLREWSVNFHTSTRRVIMTWYYDVMLLVFACGVCIRTLT